MNRPDLKRKLIFCCVLLSGYFLVNHLTSFAVTRSSNDTTMIGMPMSGFFPSTEPEEDICPDGARVVGMFMAAWQQEDYATMYSFLDEESLNDYTFEQAKFDFQFMEFNPYKISSVRRSGEDFEFFLSSGEWRDGDKEMKKMVISGKTYKIILQNNRSFFKRSL
jgi:hypothetical protein